MGHIESIGCTFGVQSFSAKPCHTQYEFAGRLRIQHVGLQLAKPGEEQLYSLMNGHFCRTSTK